METNRIINWKWLITEGAKKLFVQWSRLVEYQKEYFQTNKGRENCRCMQYH